MPSIVPGFEYDIFISYRQNDNLDGWVTEFVQGLERELKATIKEPLSMYFDKNPRDGLLETHNVDKSLEGKLKCLIFIPIISQTYCDPKSFAWLHEFCAFNRLSHNDSLGGDIHLSNGNVASRILPVRIHDLDAEDKVIIENEIGGALRSIEFIYREPGVNRPLRPDDFKADNQNKTDYRNQVNKVANATKEIISAIKFPTSATTAASDEKSKEDPIFKRRLIVTGFALLMLAIIGYFAFNKMQGHEHVRNKSIAVLPFENMNKDSTQDYFSNGISEDILNHLVKIADLRVKSRTSTQKYKSTNKTAREIGEELNVANIVEGSVRKVGNKVRIVVQLIDANNDEHLWSETYDRELEDILGVQSEIALAIANSLKAKLSANERQNVQAGNSQSITAYDYFLRAKEIGDHFDYNADRKDFDQVFVLLHHAITLDPNFSRAYASMSWAWLGTKIYGVSEKSWKDSANYYANKAIELEPNLPDGYLALAKLNEMFGKYKTAKNFIYKAYQVAPNDPEVLNPYGYYSLYFDRTEQGAEIVLKALLGTTSPKESGYYNWLCDLYILAKDYSTAEKLAVKALSLDPGSIRYHLKLAYLYELQNRPDRALDEARQAEKLEPLFQGTLDQLGWIYYGKRNYEKALESWGKFKEVEATFEDTTQVVPFRHRVGMILLKQGKEKEAEKMFREDLRVHTEILNGLRSAGAFYANGNLFYCLALDNIALKNYDQAMTYLDSAANRGFSDLFLLKSDPLLDPVRDRTDFKRWIKKETDFGMFMEGAFTKALKKARDNGELRGLD